MPLKKRDIQAEILEGLQGALSYVRGQSGRGKTHVIMVPNVQRLRRSLGLSQTTFAKRFGIPKRTVQDWEQGRRLPDQAARSGRSHRKEVKVGHGSPRCPSIILCQIDHGEDGCFRKPVDKSAIRVRVEFT
jgi:putative transcriptional regulator